MRSAPNFCTGWRSGRRSGCSVENTTTSAYRIVHREHGLALDLKVIHLIDSDQAPHGIVYVLEPRPVIDVVLVTGAFARDPVAFGITVNAVAPGPLDLPSVRRHVPPEKLVPPLYVR